MSKIIVYTKDRCIQCTFTKHTLQELGVPFELVSVENRPDLIAELKEEGFYALPVVKVEGQETFAGFQPDRLQSLAVLV